MSLRIPVTLCGACVPLVFGIAVATATPVIPDVPGPSQSNHADAIRYSAENFAAVPPGVNIAGCTPSPDHPDPVILVHGTDSTAYSDWAGLAPVLAAAGYCTYALNYGESPDGSTYGYSDIRDSAAELEQFTQSVLASTGAAAVDLIGYSQGAAVTRYYTNRLGGADAVNKWIGIASPTYGGTAYGVTPALQAVPSATKLVSAEFGPALVQMMQGSEFLTELNSGGDTVTDVEYTSIATEVDEVIQPYTNALMRDSGARNIVVQDVCPENKVAHFAFTYDPTTIALVLAALDPSATIDPPCDAVPLGSGILDVVIASN